jgi:hypothetical protein
VIEQPGVALSECFISDRLGRINEVTEAEATVKHAIRNAMNETVDLTGLRAGPAVDRLVDAIVANLLDPQVKRAICNLPPSKVEA